MVNKAHVAVLRSARDGKVMMPLETADITRLEAEGWNAPEVFVAKVSGPGNQSPHIRLAVPPFGNKYLRSCLLYTSPSYTKKQIP